jgi:hypothetical protein
MRCHSTDIYERAKLWILWLLTYPSEHSVYQDSFIIIPSCWQAKLCWDIQMKNSWLNTACLSEAHLYNPYLRKELFTEIKIKLMHFIQCNALVNDLSHAPGWFLTLIIDWDLLLTLVIDYIDYYRLPSILIDYLLQIIIDWTRWVSIGHNDSGVAREYLAAFHMTSCG